MTSSRFVDPIAAPEGSYNEPPGVAERPNALRVNVYLPDGYDPTGKDRYPVLYLLHGQGDAFDSWANPANGDLLNTAAGFPGLIVMGGDRDSMLRVHGGRRAGAGMLDLDVHATADGTLVVIHGATVDRTTDGTRPVSETDAGASSSALDAAYYFVPAAATRSAARAERVPASRACAPASARRPASRGATGGATSASRRSARSFRPLSRQRRSTSRSRATSTPTSESFERNAELARRVPQRAPRARRRR